MAASVVSTVADSPVVKADQGQLDQGGSWLVGIGKFDKNIYLISTVHIWHAWVFASVYACKCP